MAALLLLSAAIAGLALTPSLLPYLRVSREHGFTRSLAEVSEFSARLTDYLATAGRFHFSVWSHRFYEKDALFPGVIASVLAMTALVGGVGWKDRRARMAVAFGLLTFAVSFGPAFPLYPALTRVFPIMAGMVWIKRYHAMHSTPLGPGDIALGQLGWIATRITIVAASSVSGITFSMRPRSSRAVHSGLIRDR